MILEKVYDELIGMIEDLKKKVAGISGGSTVTITPVLESGTKVADFEIDGSEGSIFIPDSSWTKKTVSLTNAELNHIDTLLIPELETATEVIICSSNQAKQKRFYHFDSGFYNEVVYYSPQIAANAIHFVFGVNWGDKIIPLLTIS